MCTNSSNGINVIWRVEHPKKMIDVEAVISIYCPSSATKFKLILYYDEDEKKLSFEISGKCTESITYDGNVSVVSSTGSIKHLHKFNCLSFQDHREQEFSFQLSKEYIYGQNILTLFIQSRNSLKNKITSNYSIHSKFKRDSCNFDWKLDTQSKKTKFGDKNTPCHVFFRKIPTKFSTLNDTNELEIKLVFQNFLETNGIYLIKAIDISDRIFITIKIDAVSENRKILNLIDECIIIGYSEDFDVKKVQELIANKDLFYPQTYLTLNVYIECISFANITEFTEVDCLSDTQNVAGLIERSHKFHSQANEENSSCKTLSTSMYDLYKEKQFCDVTLCVGAEKFLCHKLVLCARSAVFNAMFENDMQEKKSSVVQIQDMNAHSFGIFLNILYTDTLLNVKYDDVIKVYEAADKYDVSEIRKMCSKFLLFELSMTNVCQILELSYKHQDEDLMNETKEFVAKHAKEVIRLPEWSDFILRNTLFAAKLMQEVFSA